MTSHILLSNTEYFNDDKQKKVDKDIKKCLEYIDKEYHDRFKDLIKNLHIDILKIGTANQFDQYKLWDNEGMNQYRNVYMIKIKRHNETISFTFCDSYQDSIDNKRPDLYDILTCVGSDYDYNKLEFKEFCSEYGYSDDSIKARETYLNWKQQDLKLHKIFTDNEIEVLPR